MTDILDEAYKGAFEENDPEFFSRRLDAWPVQKGMTHITIEQVLDNLGFQLSIRQKVSV